VFLATPEDDIGKRFWEKKNGMDRRCPAMDRRRHERGVLREDTVFVQLTETEIDKLLKITIS